jgi:hypothetical protein
LSIFIGVDHHHEIAGVDVWRKVSAMLAAQTFGDEGGEAANHGAFRIHNDPAVGDVRGFRRARRMGVHGSFPDETKARVYGNPTPASSRRKLSFSF